MHCASKLVLGLSMASWIGAAPSANAADNGNAGQQPPGRLIETVIGKKLISVDGTLITLIPSQGRLTREVMAPNGAMLRTTFSFIAERLGTVMDPRDTGKVTGVFRVGSADITIQYADGSSEILTADSRGGISVETNTPKNGVYCTRWYPEGHVFTADERKIALAQYASRLGMAEADMKQEADCNTAAKADLKSETAKPELNPVAVSPEAVSSTAKSATALANSSSKSPKAVPKISDMPAGSRLIEVRNSNIHTIDPVPPTEQAGSNPVERSATANVVSRSSNDPARVANAGGASTCLSVESDGHNWNFRNHCAYTVQFAYCLKLASSPVACKDGASMGSVAPNNVGVLVADQSLQDRDVNYEFRWIACQGGPGEVFPRLDEIDPPSGRCVR